MRFSADNSLRQSEFHYVGPHMGRAVMLGNVFLM